MSAAPKIQGWCPGALRPMRSGDGLLLRAKATGPVLPAERAREIAAIASSCGNGLIDISQRAQLQLRGVTETKLREAQERLHRLGLVARDAETESVLNFIVSPLAGLGVPGAIEAHDILAGLAAELSDDDALHALPGKFGFLIDDGGPLGLADVAADIRLEGFLEDGSPRIAIVADGARGNAFIISPRHAVATALALARAFLSLRKSREFELRRMRSVVAAFGLEALACEAGLDATPYRSACRNAPLAELFGARPLPGPPPFAALTGEAEARALHREGVSFSRGRRGRVGEWAVAGVGAPFGRFRADDLVLLAALANRHGNGELRLTPWRAVLLPCRSEESARDVIDAAARQGLIVDADDARLAVVACSGAPECPQALRATRDDLDRLAPLARRLAPEGVALHISGCAKGCAMPTAARITLVATENGFDLVDDGRARDEPSLRGLGLAEIDEAIEARIAHGNAAIGASLSKLAPPFSPRGRRRPGKAGSDEALRPSSFVESNKDVKIYSLAAPHPTPLRGAAFSLWEKESRTEFRRSDETTSTGAAMSGASSYIRDGAAIYARSFAIIRSEARLQRFTPEEERVAVRIIHACGMVEVADDIVFSPGMAVAARAALRDGAPILCDANMVAQGVTRARLPANNDVVCTLADPRVAALAKEAGTTRSAAALELWRDRLGGAVVAIGNAPTALYRLLELLDEGASPPAAIVAMPVGFVGAAESKEAALADGRAPVVIVRGRKGGSAMAAAAINALASDEE